MDINEIIVRKGYNEIRGIINSWLIVFLISSKHLTNIIISFLDVYVVFVSLCFILFTLSIYLVNNCFRINTRFIYFLVSLFVFFLVNLLFTEGYTNIAIIEFLKLLLYGCSAFLIATARFDVINLKRFWYKASVFHMAVLHLLLLFNLITRMNYMHVGFILSFINVGFAFRYYETRKVKLLVLMLYVLLLVIIFGHRGAILVNIVLVTYLFLSTRNITRQKMVTCLTMIFLIVFLLFITGIMTALLECVLSNLSHLNLKSRSIYLFLADIRKGKIFLSGREDFFRAGLKIMRDHHYVIPSGFGKFQYLSGKSFAHSILIDLPMMFGIFSLFFPVLFLKSIKDINLYAGNDFKQIYACLFIYTFTESVINNAFIIDFPFWVLVGISLTRYNYFIAWKSRSQKASAVAFKVHPLTF